MRALGLAVGLGLTAAMAAAQAETVAPADSKAHVGQTVTVEGAVSDVYTVRSGVTFINMGGRYPDNTFSAVIFSSDRAKFPDLKSLGGKTVDISGAVTLYRGKPEIVVKTADQVKTK